jgi:hypothetical protein
MAFAAFGAVAVCVIGGLIAFRWWLESRALELAAAREHALKVAQTSERVIDEGLRLLPGQMNDVLHRVKQLELTSRR